MRTELTEEKLKSLDHVLTQALPEQVRKVGQLVGAVAHAQQRLGEVESGQQSRLKLRGDELEQLVKGRVVAQGRLTDFHRVLIPGSPPDFGLSLGDTIDVVRHRIFQLNEEGRLKGWLRIVRFLGLPAVPRLVRLSVEASQAEQAAALAKQGMEAERDRVRVEFSCSLLAAQQHLYRTERSLIAFSNEQSVQDRKLARQYLKIAPEQIRPVAELYAGRYGSDPEELCFFPEFVARHASIITLLTKRYSWLEERRPPQSDEYLSLPASIRKLWLQEVKERYLLDIQRPKDFLSH